MGHTPLLSDSASPVVSTAFTAKVSRSVANDHRAPRGPRLPDMRLAYLLMGLIEVLSSEEMPQEILRDGKGCRLGGPGMRCFTIQRLLMIRSHVQSLSGTPRLPTLRCCERISGPAAAVLLRKEWLCLWILARLVPREWAAIFWAWRTRRPVRSRRP